MENIIIKKTERDDLENLMTLWNDGDVMKYVGFPNGLGVSFEDLECWLKRMDENQLGEHYSIYSDELGYCGETYYSVDETHRLGELDIKLFSKARGRGIARYALEKAIANAFATGKCDRVYVDPSPLNVKAWALYEKIGFKGAKRPTYLEPSDVFLELQFEDYKLSRLK